MKIRFSPLIVLSFIIISLACNPRMASEISDGWINLLEDKSLSGFQKLNGEAEYKMKRNTLIGISKSNTPNTFLCTREKYGDFILEFEVWADPSLNSGVQFRSKSDPDIMEGRVHGYQVEIESSDRKWAGGIYEEGKRGWLYPLDANPDAKDAFQVNEWNHYRVQALGNEIVTFVNEIQCTHLIDEAANSGFIGFQIHSINDSGLENKQIKWRDVRIKTTDLNDELWPTSYEVTLINTINRPH